MLFDTWSKQYSQEYLQHRQSVQDAEWLHITVLKNLSTTPRIIVRNGQRFDIFRIETKRTETKSHKDKYRQCSCVC